MSIRKTVAFGKMWRYECDGGQPDGCDETQATLAEAPVPEGWTVDKKENVYCRAHRDEAEL